MGDEEDDEDQPLSLAWPDTFRKQITYLIILPIVLPLWLTLPDVRREVTTPSTRSPYMPQCVQSNTHTCWTYRLVYLVQHQMIRLV